MAEPTVIVTDHNFPDLSLEQELLERVAHVEELNMDDEDRMASQLSEARAVLVRMFDIDRDLIDKLDNCRVISRYGIGVDHISVEAATQKGIYVCNAPTYCTDEVSIHTVTLILNLHRHIKRYDSIMANGGWKSEPPTFSSERGKYELPIRRHITQTVGVVGFGTLGQTVGEMLSKLGFCVIASDPYLSPDDMAEYDVELTSFDDLVTTADSITIHSPLTDDTHHLFDEDAFSKMKDTACIVNCARGPIVDEDALLAALSNGEIDGAALDVFEDEPPEKGNRLRDHDRIITTPHIAYYSEEADTERREQAIENVRAVLQGETPPYPINEP